MTVMTALGCYPDHIDRILADSWPGWQADNPHLPRIVGSVDLRRWMRTAQPGEADLVLRTLGRLAAEDDGDDTLAAAVLAWLMLPAASLVAYQLRRLDPDIDFHVAAQLWIEVRSVPWRGHARIAPGLRWRLLRRVADDVRQPATPCGLDPTEGEEAEPESGGLPVEDELDELLVAAWRAGVLSEDDCDLLVAVLSAAAEVATPGRASAALLGEKVSGAVAPRWGVTARQIRRRTARCIRALTDLATA